jgi:putative ABC transport system substrate-binding protein
LHETVSGATRIALLVNPNNPGLMQDNIRLTQAAVKRLGLEMIVVKAGSESEIESAVVAAAQWQANALSIGNDAYLSSLSRQISSFALKHALPTMSESRDGVAAGLLMSYGPNQAETFRQAGLSVGRILKGERPADLPVIEPTTVELFINRTTAKALGLEVPPQLLGRADEVIE